MPAQTFQLDSRTQATARGAAASTGSGNCSTRPTARRRTTTRCCTPPTRADITGVRSANRSTAARGEWQCSRVYATLGRAEPALYHGRRCLEFTEKHGLSPFDIGCAHEAIARAARLAGIDEQADKHAALATAAAEEITDPEERQVLLADIATL